jgi:hypothetical protein
MLIQAQGAAGSAQTAGTAAFAAGGTSADGGTIALSPEQRVAADLQALMSNPQSAATPNTRVANANPADPAVQTGHHRHHHHHERGGQASGASAVAQSSVATGTASASSATTSGNAALSRVFAADIGQALRAYAGQSAAAAPPTSTA